MNYSYFCSIENLKNIFARNCVVRRIAKPEAKAFLDANHRLGDTTCRYRYGLFSMRSTGSAEAGTAEGTLVAVATFSNARRWQKGERRVSSYEWIRYASLGGYRVIGGMGKLLSAFVEEVRPDNVMSYADAGWTDGGEAYRILGFVEECRVERAGRTDIKYRLTFDSENHIFDSYKSDKYEKNPCNSPSLDGSHSGPGTGQSSEKSH